MTTKHTDGPWNAANAAGGHQGLIIEEKTGRTVAISYDTADAPTIAAAPALLQALKDAEFLLRNIGMNWREAASMADSCKRSAADARYAIEQAEGHL